MAVSGTWADCGKEITLERLTERDLDNMVIEYERITDDSIVVSFDDASVTVAAGDRLPAAGTYRLTIKYIFNGFYFAESQMTFFVNYTGANLADTLGGTGL